MKKQMEQTGGNGNIQRDTAVHACTTDRLQQMCNKLHGDLIIIDKPICDLHSNII